MNRRAKAYTYLTITMLVMVLSLWLIGRAWDYTIDTYNSPTAPQYTHTTD